MNDPAPARLDVLEPEGRPLPVRRLAVLGVVLALVGGAAFLVDHRIRVREEAALAGCTSAVREAVGLQQQRIAGMASYVRTTATGDVPARVRAGVLDLVAGVARTAPAGLADARATCTAVQVRSFHPGLADHRDRCLSVLDDSAAYFSAVAVDGGKAYSSTLRTLDC